MVSLIKKASPLQEFSLSNFRISSNDLINNPSGTSLINSNYCTTNRYSIMGIITLLVFLFSGNSLSAQKHIAGRSDFIKEKKVLAKEVGQDQTLSLTKAEFSYIEVSMEDLRVEIKQLKKDVKKAKLFNDKALHTILSKELEAHRQMAKDFIYIRQKSTEAI